jgi:penicillin V acylase-like amidase (Ntn superfamily)
MFTPKFESDTMDWHPNGLATVKKGRKSMKQIVITIIIILATCINPALSGACTSFAVYSEKTLYGINFDYSLDVAQKFTISSGFQGKLFQMAFRAPFGFADIVGMNIKGLFASCQMLFPEGKPPAAKNKNQISTAVFHQMALSRFEKVPQVENFLNKRKVVHTIGVSLHNLVADRFGDAVVVEVG